MSESLAVLITYHNEGAWLTECIESVLHQPAPPDEIIIYDDASEKPAQQYIPDDKRVRVIRGEENIGPARSRNLLLKSAKSVWTHFHDADDWFAPDWCARIRSAMPNADLILTDVKIIADDETRPHVMDLALCDVDLIRFAIRGAVLVPSTTFRRELAVQAGGYNESLHQSEDYEFHVRLIARASSIKLIPDDLALVRAHASNRSRKTEEVWGSAVDALLLLEPQLPRQYRPELAAAAAKAGRILYQAGATSHAKRAFDAAQQLAGGPVPFAEPRMRLLARLFGPMGAERVARLYRTLPKRLKLFSINAS